MGTYFRTSEMVTGGPFRCYNCGKSLISKVEGEGYRLKLFCPRCKASITVDMREKLPYVKTKDQMESEVKDQGITHLSPV